MPKATVEPEKKWEFEPGVYYPCVLSKVEESPIRWNDKQTGEPRERMRWRWTFKISEGDSAGLHINMDTEPGITNAADDKVKMAVEALLETTFTLGMEIDTDQYIGLPCFVTVLNPEPREIKSGARAGQLFYDCPVDSIFPSSMDVSSINEGRVETFAGVVDQSAAPPY